MRSKNGPPQILIVGDLTLSRGLMRMVLSRLEYIVLCVGSAQEATVALTHNRFALALVSTRLPDGSGLTFSRQIRENLQSNQPLPVILFGDTWDQDAMSRVCRSAGIQGFLGKPLSISRLVENVRQWTGGCSNSSFNAEQIRVKVGKKGSLALQDIINLNHLKDFTGEDFQLEGELASLYVSTAKQYLERMEENFASAADWERLAHSLKGSSANIGAIEMARLALEAEKKEPDQKLLEKLNDGLQQVIAFFDQRASSRRVAAQEVAGY